MSRNSFFSDQRWSRNLKWRDQHCFHVFSLALRLPCVFLSSVKCFGCGSIWIRTYRTELASWIWICFELEFLDPEPCWKYEIRITDVTTGIFTNVGTTVVVIQLINISIHLLSGTTVFGTTVIALQLLLGTNVIGPFFKFVGANFSWIFTCTQLHGDICRMLTTSISNMHAV